MKKKRLLSMLVMLSLMHSSVYAEEVNPGTYNDFYEYSGEGTNQTQIKDAGEYTFVNGASIINTDLENDDGAQAIIHHSGTKGIINKITINVGNDENRSQFILKGESDISILEENINKPNGSLVLFTLNNNIINAYDYSETNINAKNTDICLTGTFMNGISSDEEYYLTAKVYTNDIKFTVDGNNSTNFYIYGNMFTGINAGDSGKYNFDNLNNFKIINTYQPTKVQSNQIGIWLRCDTQMDIDADNLYIGGLNGSDETVFGTAFKIINGSILNVSVNDEFTLTSSKIGLYNNASYAYINAGTVNIYATGADASTGYGAILQGGGYLNLRATNNINLSGSGVGLRFNFQQPSFSTNGSIEYDEKVLGETEVASEKGSIFIEGREGYGLLSEIRQHQDSVKKAVVTADKDIEIKGKKAVFLIMLPAEI